MIKDFIDHKKNWIDDIWVEIIKDYYCVLSPEKKKNVVDALNLKNKIGVEEPVECSRILFLYCQQQPIQFFKRLLMWIKKMLNHLLFCNPYFVI
jgi:hypothetical protein